jgi:streptogramin lyase
MDDFSVPAGPSGIATGSDGNLWFTEYALAKIGRFVPP